MPVSPKSIIVALVERDDASDRDLVDRKLALGEDVEHLAPDIAGRARDDDPITHHYVPNRAALPGGACYLGSTRQNGSALFLGQAKVRLMPDFPIDAVRARFPALARGTVFFDAPGGTQACDAAIAAMTRHLTEGTANAGGPFATSVETDQLSADAHAAMADLLGAQPEEIAFGPNMTQLTFAVSRALARDWQAGDELIVTRLDHDANVAPWLQAAEDRGMTVRWLDFDPATGRWSLDDLAALLGPKTRLVALGAASNALGTLNPIAEACALVRARQRRPDLYRRGPVGPARRHRRHRARLRFPRLLAVQILRPAPGRAVDAPRPRRRAPTRSAPPATTARTASRPARRRSRARPACSARSTISNGSAARSIPPPTAAARGWSRR